MLRVYKGTLEIYWTKREIKTKQTSKKKNIEKERKGKKRKQQQIINDGDVAIPYWIISQIRLVLAC